MFGLHYKLVTFDALKTLIKLAVRPEAKYAEAAAMNGINCSKEAIAMALPYNFKKMTRDHPNYGQKTGIGWNSWWHQVISETLRDAKCVATDEQIATISKQLINLYKSEFCWKIREGAMDLLTYLDTRKMLMGVISNADPRLHDILGSLKILHFFRFVLTSYEMKCEKCDLKAFNEARFRSGLINLKAEECIHVGDCAITDYYAAVNHKWRGILVRPDKGDFIEAHPTVNPHDVFPTLHDVLSFMVLENNPKPSLAGRFASGEKTEVKTDL